MQYLTRMEGPAAYGTKLGVVGIIHTTEKGAHICDVLFEMVVDSGVETDDDWTVVGIFSPRKLDGTMTGGHTALLFGDTQRRPFKTFEDAHAFCRAVCVQLYDRMVPSGWVDKLAHDRGLRCWQWLDVELVAVAGPEEEPVGDPGDDGEGDTCDVQVSVPARRVLH